jgi:hypothetical protein
LPHLPGRSFSLDFQSHPPPILSHLQDDPESGPAQEAIVPEAVALRTIEGLDRAEDITLGRFFGRHCGNGVGEPLIGDDAGIPLTLQEVLLHHLSNSSKVA